VKNIMPGNPAQRQPAREPQLTGIQRELDELVRLGYVRRLPGGRYTLTELGEQALKAGDDGR
jgi:hypothetical protein